MAPVPDSTSLDDAAAVVGHHELNNVVPPIRRPAAGSSSSSSSSSSSLADEHHGPRRRWGSVKTWMFGQLLASSFARVSLHADSDDRPPSPSSSPPLTKHAAGASATTSATVSASSSCSSLASLAASDKTPASISTSAVSSSTSSSRPGCNDWDCSYASLTASASSTRSNQEPPAATATVSTSSPSTSSAKRLAFDICRVIGSGSYGTVLLARGRSPPPTPKSLPSPTPMPSLVAIKMVPKCKLHGDEATREAQRLRTERRVLAAVDHPFITKLFCAFETPQSLNFVLEYCAGGDLYFLLEKFVKNRLPEPLVVFYAASVALALGYLHARGILYRDLKPENLLLDAEGFVRLADFGFAREHVSGAQTCTSFCGSADYVAPEVVAGTGYGLAADLWSFGCVIYELLTGFPPFYSPRDRGLLFRKIAHAEPSFPSHFSPQARDLLTKLLAKDAAQRLGAGPNGMADVFAHPFFASIDWYQLATKQVVPPYVPSLSSPSDTSNFEAQFTSQHVDGSIVYEPREKQQSADPARLFDDFDWCADASAFA